MPTKSAKHHGVTAKGLAFDKYDLYVRSVQQPDVDVLLFKRMYDELTGKEPRTLREDFCGTFGICCEWAKLGEDYVAHGLDLDAEPVNYGKKRFYSRLSPQEQSRVRIQLKNVLDRDVPTADIIAAQNFSYFIFKKREELRAYLENCLFSLKPGGLMLMDIFGGSQCQGPIEDTTDNGDFTYCWDQKSWDPISHHAEFSIHFRIKGKKKIRDCFTYDWRMWTIPEVREIMREVGFRKTHVYWEGTEGEEGNGIFDRVEVGEDCESWIAYVVGEK